MINSNKKIGMCKVYFAYYCVHWHYANKTCIKCERVELWKSCSRVEIIRLEILSRNSSICEYICASSYFSYENIFYIIIDCEIFLWACHNNYIHIFQSYLNLIYIKKILWKKKRILYESLSRLATVDTSCNIYITLC